MGRGLKSGTEFAPWKRQRAIGLQGLAIAIGIALLAVVLPYGPWSWVLGFICVVIFGISFENLRKAASREFGKTLEAHWINKATLSCPINLRIRSSVRVPGLGDADMLIEQPGLSGGCVVEIKSFMYWRAPFFGLLPGKREVGALAQAERLRQRLSCSDAIVWLPQGKPTLWQSFFEPKKGKVRVIFGGANALWAAVKHANKENTLPR